MPPDVNKTAETLMAEHGSGVKYRPFAAASGIASVTDAYAVQREYVRLQMQARNTSVGRLQDRPHLQTHAGRCAGSIARSPAWFWRIASMPPARAVSASA